MLDPNSPIYLHILTELSLIPYRPDLKGSNWLLVVWMLWATVLFFTTWWVIKLFKYIWSNENISWRRLSLFFPLGHVIFLITSTRKWRLHWPLIISIVLILSYHNVGTENWLTNTLSDLVVLPLCYALFGVIHAIVAFFNDDLKYKPIPWIWNVILAVVSIIAFNSLVFEDCRYPSFEEDFNALVSKPTVDLYPPSLSQFVVDDFSVETMWLAATVSDLAYMPPEAFEAALQDFQEEIIDTAYITALNHVAVVLHTQNVWLIGFRGTEDIQDIFSDINMLPDFNGESGFKHKGFSDGVELFEQHPQWQDVIERIKGGAKSVLITGHSLGGALATLAAHSFLRRHNIQISLYTFGQPAVGDYTYARRLHKDIRNYIRVRRLDDPVPALPSFTQQLIALFPVRYAHAGQLHVLGGGTIISRTPTAKEYQRQLQCDSPSEIFYHSMSGYLASAKLSVEYGVIADRF